ncbi:hypothetical protein ANCCAN_29616, partial [Ancylostoma caninum]
FFREKRVRRVSRSRAKTRVVELEQKEVERPQVRRMLAVQVAQAERSVVPEKSVARELNSICSTINIS